MFWCTPLVQIFLNAVYLKYLLSFIFLFYFIFIYRETVFVQKMGPTYMGLIEIIKELEDIVVQPTKTNHVQVSSWSIEIIEKSTNC